MKPWLQDKYTKRAQKENFLARSVYKLMEIDKKEALFKGAKCIIDLGASPGSWSQYCLKKAPQAKVIAVDLEPLRIEDRRIEFLQKDIETVNLESVLSGVRADVVLSDMAPKTSGVHDQDVWRSYDLSELALGVAKNTLQPNGVFVTKIFMGETFEPFNRQMIQSFRKVKRLRPEGTRKHSREIYFIGRGLKAQGAASV